MSIRLENISKYFDHTAVVNNISLEIKDGEFFVLLGSSGSGKTTVLNIIAGLIAPDKGKVLLHDRDVTYLPTQKRRIGYVFQNYALFQYMSVAQNIEFGLKIRKVPKLERVTRRDELLELVGLVGLGERMPGQLSGGQQQRVALARALALEPDVLLLDEPLGALDAKIRVDLRRSLKRIQRQSGVAAILVTHDQEEAFDLADRIGVMNYGRLIEVGTPQDLYRYPRTEYVASFLGSANLLLGNINEDQVYIGSNSFPIPEETIHLSSNDRAQILFRPEDVALAGSEGELGCLPLGKGRIIEKGFNGSNERLQVEIPAIQGVRAISPSIPFGLSGFVMEVNRSAEQSTNLPLSLGKDAWVGIRRLHVLSHPGLNFLLLTDGSLRSQSAISMCGYLARMAHAHVLMLGLEENKDRLHDHIQTARKQIGSGMASLQTLTSGAPFEVAIAEAVEKKHIDLAVLGWRPTAGLDQPEKVLSVGEHHLLLATEPTVRLGKALICLASGEPAKDTVVFAGRFLRHLGAEATLMTVLPDELHDDFNRKRVERFLSGGQSSLVRYGVPAETKIKTGGLVAAVQEEMKNGAYDLVVLGAPLPELLKQKGLSGVIGSILTSVENCSFLIIQSQPTLRNQNPFGRLK